MSKPFEPVLKSSGTDPKLDRKRRMRDAVRLTNEAISKTDATQEEIAHVLGISRGKFARKLTSEPIGFHDVMQLPPVMRHVFARALAESLGLGLVERADASDTDALMASVAGEAGDVMRKVADAAKDGVITADEGASLEKEGAELEAAGRRVRELGTKAVRERGLRLAKVGT